MMISERVKKRANAALAAVLAAGLLLSGCGGIQNADDDAAKEEKTEDLKVSVMEPTVSSIVLQGEFIGTLEPEEQTAVAAKMSGEVTNQYFEVGDMVKKGDVLFTLDDTASRLQLENAQATYTAAQAGAVQQMGSLDLQMAQAQNNLEQAQNGITTAENGVASAIDGYDKVKNQKEDLQGSLSDVESARNKADEYYQTLNGLNSRLNSVKEKIDLFNQTEDIPTKSNLAGEIAGALGTDTSNIGLSSGAIDNLAKDTQIDSTVCTVRFEDQYLRQVGMTVASLPSATTAAKSAYDTASSSYSQIKSSVGSLESQETSLYNSKTSAITGYNQAVSGKTLAEKNYEYTANYTVPGTTMTVQSQLKQAEIAVESARLQLNYAKVTAPVSGRIEAINVSRYAVAQAGSPAYIITNADNVIVNFKVSESVMKNLSPDQPVGIEKDGISYNGYITEISDSVDVQSGLFKIKAVVEGDKNSLYNGAAVKLTMDTDQAKNVMTLPIDAVYYEDGKPYVYCADGAAAAKTYIETGLFNDDVIEVTSGLTAASRVITSWSPLLRDGAPIATDTAEEAASIRENLPSAGEASLLLGCAQDAAPLRAQGESAHE